MDRRDRQARASVSRPELAASPRGAERKSQARISARKGSVFLHVALNAIRLLPYIDIVHYKRAGEIGRERKAAG